MTYHVSFGFILDYWRALLAGLVTHPVVNVSREKARRSVAIPAGKDAGRRVENSWRV